ncbi:hypothetical protein [Nocardioides sp. Soil805]|uniref:hypothetical protein n=1 Tax=Nocardioides sp. Soil805 TaxID=1736416 RepID=UPI000AF8BE63|nr:hypothetical protein [Nocardioides sp. Soil805]
MAAFNRPRAHADEAREALRHLVHAIRHVEDPTEIYSVLGELTSGVASLAQSLHQIAEFHEGLARQRAWVRGDTRAGCAASYQVAWELHRAGEIVHQVANGLDRAHGVEATIAYDALDLLHVEAVPQQLNEHGPSL